MDEHEEDEAGALFPCAGSLFPISKVGNAENVPQPAWLSNSSFSETLLPLRVSSPPPPPENDAPSSRSDDEGDISDDKNRKKTRSDGEAVSDDKNRKKRKKKKSRDEKSHRKKHKKRDAAEDVVIGSLRGKADRKPDTDIWITENQQKDYFFDAHGDRDNLAFGSIYKLDLARFHSYNSQDTIPQGRKWKQKIGIVTPEADGLVQEDGKRYWSSKVISLERRQDYKRLRITSDHSKRINQEPLVDSFVSLAIDPDDKMKNAVEPREESYEDYVLRRTREFSQMTHEKPQDRNTWFFIAKFQDDLINSAPKKSLRLHAIDKKILLLEKALQHHPNDEELVLLYLDTCGKREDASSLISKWQRTITKHSGSYRLWCGYLKLCRSSFSSFSVSSIRRLYSQALQALIAARNRKDTANLVDAEMSIVSMFSDLCRFEWQSGYHELAVGLFQAQFEYSLLCPAIQLPGKHKLRLFEAFWNSGAPRIGEQGAVGWSSWMEKQEVEVQKASAIDTHKEEDDNVWGGLEQARVSQNQDTEVPGADTDAVVDEDEDVNNEDEEDDAALIEKLGLNLDLAKDTEVKDARIWKRWSEEETQRDRTQWLPVKSAATSKRSRAANADKDDMEVDEEEDENLPKMVLFDDIREFIFSLSTEEARCQLIGEFSEFCHVPLFQWCCSNTRGYKEQIDARDVLTSNFIATSFDDQNLGTLLLPADWIKESEGRAAFVRNAFLLLRNFVVHKFQFQEVLLSLETVATPDTANSAKALAKNLLKVHRHDLTLWAAYASFEASAGNIETSRKVFDNALTSLSAHPKESQLDASIVYLAYAEVEMGANPENGQRVLYILYFLATGETFIPSSSSGLTRTQILKGRRGYSEQLQKLRQSGNLTERGACLIICAALFEQLSFGWQAAASIFEECLAMTTPENRKNNMHFERVQLFYVSMLESQKSIVRPAVIRQAAKEGLMQYPYNLKLLNFYTHSSPANETRRLIDEIGKRNPSSLLWLFTLSWELSKSGAKSHIHGLLERALEAGGNQSALLWRCYIAFELGAGNPDAARRVFFRAIHACPWSKALWMDGFEKLNAILSVKELSELVDIMQDKELRMRTDVYEILLQEVA